MILLFSQASFAFAVYYGVYGASMGAAVSTPEELSGIGGKSTYIVKDRLNGKNMGMACLSSLGFRQPCSRINLKKERVDKMTILVAVKKEGKVFLGADRITTFGNEYVTDLVGGSKIIKLKHAYIATSGYSLLDNVIEHLYHSNHKMMENPFKNRSNVFAFFLDLYNELKKSYTLVEPGKDTYASMYNVFLVVTPTSIYGVSTNLSVSEYDRYAARGAGADYAVGCLYGLYDVVNDGFELTRLALESACHFSVYCKEPIDIIKVKAEDFGRVSKDSHKVPESHLTTIPMRKGFQGLDVKPIMPSQIVLSSNGNSKKATSKTMATVAAAAKASSKPPAPKGKGGSNNKSGKSGR